MKYINTYENRLLNNIKSVFDYRIKLADKLVSLINELFPKTKCRYVVKNSTIYIKIHQNTDLVLIGKIIHYNSDEFSMQADRVFNMNILPEHSIYEFLFDIFKDYEEFDRITVKYDDIPHLMIRITKDNYEKFLIEQDTNKYNL